MEMSHKSRGQRRSTTTRRSSSTNETIMLYDFLVKVGSIIYNIAVDKKPKEFNGRLGTVHLHQWHVYIIDKDKALRIPFGTYHFLTSFLYQLGLNTLLD